MSQEDRIQGIGVIVGTQPNGTLCVEMPNGYRATAFVPAKTRVEIGVLSPGDRVTVEMSSFDLSSGRITGRS